MSSQLLALLVCVIFVSQSLCSPYTHDENRVLCGTDLVERMNIVCKYHNNSPMSKEAVNWNLADTSDHSDDFVQNALSSYRWLDNDVNSFIPSRHQRGIAEECCRKPCSDAVLRSFC